VDHQRQQYRLRSIGKPSTLTDARLEKLVDLGFEFVVTRRLHKGRAPPHMPNASANAHLQELVAEKTEGIADGTMESGAEAMTREDGIGIDGIASTEVQGVMDEGGRPIHHVDGVHVDVMEAAQEPADITGPENKDQIQESEIVDAVMESTAVDIKQEDAEGKPVENPLVVGMEEDPTIAV